MTVFKRNISINTAGKGDIIDITSYIKKIVGDSGLKDGIVNVFVLGSTASITTIEYESGLLRDFNIVLDKIMPYNKNYEHHKKWGDDNAHSHIRASIIGPEVTIPFADANLMLGTWQQVVLIDFDTRSREREIVVTCVGE